MELWLLEGLADERELLELAIELDAAVGVEVTARVLLVVELNKQAVSCILQEED